MRKHFLLLFLMALLPLAGFAVTTDVTFKTAGANGTAITTAWKYDATEKDLPVPYKIGNDEIEEYVVSKAWYKTTVDANGNVVKTGSALEKLEDAGKYICEFQVNQGNHQGSHTAIFEIAKCELTVTASNLTNGANQGDPQNALTYGDAFTADNVKVTFAGWPNAIDTDAKRNPLINSFGTITYTTDYVPFESGVTTAGHEYAIVPIITGLVSDNYDFKAVHGKLQVVAKDLANGQFTVTVSPRFYDGTAADPTFSVVDLANPGTPVADGQFGLLYYETSDATNAMASNPLHAGTYYVALKPAANSNYTGTFAGDRSVYKIRPALLRFTLKEPEITYDGQEHNLAAAALYDIDVLATGDDIASLTVETQTYNKTKKQWEDYKTSGTNPTFITNIKNYNEFGYKITSIVPTFTTGSKAKAGDYNVKIETPLFKINQAEIEITFKNKTMQSDEAVTIKNGIAITVGANSNADTYFAVVKEPVTGESITAYPNVKATKNAETGIWEIAFASGNPTVKDSQQTPVNTTSNYKFTINKGILTINADLGILYVIPQNDVYGKIASERFVKVKVVSADDSEAATAKAAELEEILNNDKVTIKPYMNAQDEQDPKNGKLLGTVTGGNAEVEYPAAGTYTITFDEEVQETEAWLAIAADYNIDLNSRTTYIINKAPLKIKLNNQSLVVGDDDDDLVADKYTVEFDGQVPGDAKDLYAAVQNKLILTGTVTGNTYYDNGLKDDAINYNQERVNATDEETTKGYFANAITLENGFALPNYAVTIEQMGGLFVSADDVDVILNLNPVTKADWDELTDAVKANNSTNITANKNHKVKTVTFDDFELKAEKWYPMVLPFNTTVKELSQKFGYAVVNILNTENTDDAIRFKLHMQDIKANQPFLIKIVEDKVMGDANPTVAEGEVWFEGKTIVDSDNNADVNENTGIQFIGFYDAKIGVTDHDFWYHPAGGYDARYGGKADPNRYLRPLNAFVQTPAGSSAKVIYVEDPVQGVTAIESISAEGAEAIPVQGWYTINGIKLEGVPTEKGIYINNGKKVVIK